MTFAVFQQYQLRLFAAWRGGIGSVLRSWRW